MRAKPRSGAGRAAAGLRGTVRRGGDDPDRRAPPVGGLREGKAGWAGGKEKKITGRRWCFVPREGKRKRREREMGWAGRAKICWAERRKRGGEKRKVLFFAEDFKQIQFESTFEEFKFKLNHNIKTMQG